MNTTKKLLLGLGGLATIGMAAATVVSCSETTVAWPENAPTKLESQDIKKETNTEYANSNISGVRTYGNPFATEITKNLSNLNKQRVKLITAGGKKDDKSFNQSIWEAISLYGEQTKNGEHAVTETVQDTELSSAYDTTLNEGKYGIWVLTGFQQGTAFNQWLANGNFDKFVASGSVVIGVDWTPSETETFSKLCFDHGRIISLNFKARQAAYVMGRAAAQYLAETYPDKPEDRTLSSFGGGIYAGVTSFNNGFLQALVDHNTKNPNKKVKFLSGEAGDKTIILNSGFDANSQTAIDIVNNVVATKAKIILPVAGTLTDAVLQGVTSESVAGRMVIGVDSDYEKAQDAQNAKNAIFSSVLKNVGIAVYQAMLEITLPNIFDLVEGKTNYLKDFDYSKTGINYTGGYEASFVGVANNTNGTVATKDKINNLLQTAYDESFGPNGKKPTFEKDMINNPNNNQDELNALVVKINA